MHNYEEFSDAPPNEVPVRGFLHRPTSPSGDCLVLTHGAGANCDSPLLVALANAFCASGLTVLRCDLPFRQLRPHGPPPRGSAERNQQGLRAAIATMRHQISGRVFLGGHSYGGRQASMLAAASPVFCSPALTRLRISAICTGVSDGFRPLYTPAFFARAIPSRCLSLMMALSNSDTAPMMESMSMDMAESSPVNVRPCLANSTTTPRSFRVLTK